MNSEASPPEQVQKRKAGVVVEMTGTVQSVPPGAENLGLQAPAISWGVLLNESQAIRVLATAPWLLIPGIFIIISILAFNFVGDGLRDAADPYANF